MKTTEETLFLNPDNVLKIVANHFRLNPEDIKSKSRVKEIVHARYHAIFFIKEYCNVFVDTYNYKKMSHLLIGEMFNIDHTTVTASLARIETFGGKKYSDNGSIWIKDQRFTNHQFKKDLKYLNGLISGDGDYYLLKTLIKEYEDLSKAIDKILLNTY